MKKIFLLPGAFFLTLELFAQNNTSGNKLVCIRVYENIPAITISMPTNKMGFKNTGSVITDIGAGFVMDDYTMRYEL